MSRYFQSSYHGSNDYKKYRQQKLGKNNEASLIKDQKPYAQIGEYRFQLKRNSAKEHLQTFGKQTNREQSRRQNNYNDAIFNHRQSSKNQKAQESVSQSCSLSRGYTNNIKEANHEDKTSRYMNDRYKANERQAFMNEQTRTNKALSSLTPQTDSIFKESFKSRQTTSRPCQIQKEVPITNNFQDSIISRRKNYGNLTSLSNDELNIYPKAYNYSSKLENKQKQSYDWKEPYSKEISFAKETKFEDKYKAKYDISSTDVPSSSPYRSRNQMVKERLNIKDHQQNQSYRGIKRQFHPSDQTCKGLQTKKQNLKSQIKTTQVTPQKSVISIREERNASEQRRKSLIQKSQMLKEKLNRLNGSSNTKAVENQQNCSNTKLNQKENSVQNYTPKRYLTNSFRANYDDTQKVDKSVSKKLNFEETTNEKEPLKTMDRNTSESRQPSTRNYYTNSANRSTTPLNSKQPLSTEVVGEGALRKISELNERINSRLESILKNYG